ncbi:MAG: hypothetical protein ACOH15_02565 [Acetobacterium sp.]
MGIGDLIELLGSLTVLCFILAISNYFVKVVNKKYINKLGVEKKPFVDLYRKIMKVIIKNHKLVGTIAIAAMLTHLFIGVTSNNIRILGIVSALLMGAIFILGFYGAFINKNKKAVWLKIHRILPFILIIAIGMHVIIK